MPVVNDFGGALGCALFQVQNTQTGAAPCHTGGVYPEAVQLHQGSVTNIRSRYPGDEPGGQSQTVQGNQHIGFRAGICHIIAVSLGKALVALG